MALLLAGLPESVPGLTLNRLCASGLDAVGAAGRAIRAGEIDFAIAGGVESMTRAPFVMGKAPEAFSRSGRYFRHHHRLALHQSADEGAIRRRCHAGDRRETSPRNFRCRAPIRTRSRSARSSAPALPIASGYFAEEITPVSVPGGKAGPISVDKDEHPRPETTLEGLTN
jgi:3-oxoadipyl-CoA thiolase